jgi:hypothetical protein
MVAVAPGNIAPAGGPGKVKLGEAARERLAAFEQDAEARAIEADVAWLREASTHLSVIARIGAAFHDYADYRR